MYLERTPFHWKIKLELQFVRFLIRVQSTNDEEVLNSLALMNSWVARGVSRGQ